VGGLVGAVQSGQQKDRSTLLGSKAILKYTVFDTDACFA
jgi:hypothetical protein